MDGLLSGCHIQLHIREIKKMLCVCVSGVGGEYMIYDSVLYSEEYIFSLGQTKLIY